MLIPLGAMDVLGQEGTRGQSVSIGELDPKIGRLLGRAKVEKTHYYAHQTNVTKK